MAGILVVVPASRQRCGRLILLSSAGDTVSGPFRVLAKASRRNGRKQGNPECARWLPFGDPPTGSYAITGSWPPSTLHRRPQRFGRLGGLLLEPRAGEARAALSHGRRVFALHGGRTDSAGRLYPTRGGLRLDDADLLTLLRAVNASQERGDPASSLEIVDVDEELVPGSGDSVPANRRRGSYERAPGGVLGLTMLLGAGVSRPGGHARRMGRRRFVAAALVLVGGLGATACEQSSPDDADDVDGGDAGCPPHDRRDGGHDADAETGDDHCGGGGFG